MPNPTQPMNEEELWAHIDLIARSMEIYLEDHELEKWRDFILADRNAAIREALLDEWEHIDADGDDASKVYYWYIDGDKYICIPQQERIDALQSQPNAKEDSNER